MLKLHKNKKRILYFSAMSALVMPLAAIGISRTTEFDNASAASNIMSEGFADQNFYNCVLEAYRSAHPDEEIPATGLNDAQLGSLTQLSCSDQGIENISGAEKLTSVWNLALTNNRISNLAPLSELRLLQWLTLGDNNIIDISPLNNLQALTSLSLKNNNITDISALSRLHSLKTLQLQNNSIFDISSLASVNNLTYLDISSNYISDITPLWYGLGRNIHYVLDDNAIFDFWPISERSISIRATAARQNAAVVTDTRNVVLPKLFEQVKDATSTRTIYTLLYTAEDFTLTNAILSDDGKSIEIVNIAETASVTINGGIADGTTYSVVFRGNLNSIVAPTAVVDIPNGAEKTAEGLSLPGAVFIDLENEIRTTAFVSWEISDSAYDPFDKSEQIFTIRGDVTLPDYIANKNNIPLYATITITINAAESQPLAPDAGRSTIMHETSIEEKYFILPTLLLMLLALPLIMRRS